MKSNTNVVNHETVTESTTTSLSAHNSVIRDRVSWHAWRPSLAERLPHFSIRWASA